MATKKQAEILKAAGYVAKNGRPYVGGSWIPRATSSVELREKLNIKAAEMGVTVTEAVREAVQKWVGGAQSAQ